jgi:protein-glutamine gamma-glutamyltransferase
MKTPPFLIGATLLFWGYQSGQTGLLIAGAVMGLILEGARFIKVRWEFSDDEFARVWTFCNLLLLAAMILAFHSNGGISTFSELFEDPNSASERNAGNVGQLTADVLFRWLPIIFFLFVATQAYSSSNSAPLETLFFLWRNRLKRARKRGQVLPPLQRFDASYPYFGLCLVSAAGRATREDYFYYGFSILLAWALWPQRSRRFALPVWMLMTAAAIILGYYGQRTFGQLSHLAEEYDPQLISWLLHPLDPKKSITNIGDVGRLQLSGRIVIRLQPLGESLPPTYLREATYRYLDEQPENNLHESAPRQTFADFFEGILRVNNLHEFRHKHTELVWETANTNNNFIPVLEQPPESGIFPLHSGPPNRSMVTIACYLDDVSEDENRYPEGLLPLPADCNRLENSRAYSMSQSGLGTVLAEGPRLMIFDARYGSGAIMDDKPEANESQALTNEDLYVPSNEVSVLQEVISNLNVSGQSEEKKLLAVSQYFTHFTYNLWQNEPPPFDTNTTALARFLLTTKSGHCEYFATATVLLLREMGIPARYAVGYYVHEPSGHGGYVVRLRDGHAWCLVWDKNTGSWRNFDTTPADWVAKEDDRESSFQFLSDFQSWLEYEVLKFFDYNHNDIRDYVFWALIPALAYMLYRIFRGGRRQKTGPAAERQVWPGIDSEFYQLEQKLVRNGLPREPGESLHVWLRRVTDDSRLAELKQPLENILVLHYRYRFDPRGLNPSERQALQREVEACLSSVPNRN